MKLLSRNKEILILFLVALVSRFFLALTARGIATDGCAYIRLAKEIAGGNFHELFISILPPLFPILTAVASYIFRDIELSGRIISCLFGSLTVFPLFFLVKSIFNKKIALITVLFLIIHPYLSNASGTVLTEALYFFLVTTIVFLCWTAIQKKKSHLFLVVGLMLFLACLTRPEGIALIFWVLMWIWFINLSKIRTEFRWKLTSSFFCLIIFIVVLSLFLFFIHHETERWQIPPRYEQYVKFHYKSTGDQSYLQIAKAVLRYQLSVNVPQIPFFFVKAYHPLFLFFLLFGAVNRKRFGRFRIGEAYILSFILFRTAVLVVFAGITDRYFYAFIPIALSWAAVGFWEIDYCLQEKFKDKILLIGRSRISHLSIMLLVIVTAICLPSGLRPIRGHRAVQREAGYWLKENAGCKDFIVASPSPQEPFYAGAKWYKLKGNTYTEIIDDARQQGTDFIIVDQGIDRMCPEFRDSVREEDLEVFTRKFEENRRKIVIYKLKV